MIHHLSLPAEDPRHVAEVLVELFDGVLTEFGPYRDSWIAWAGDEHGTAVEVYPKGTQMLPGEGPGQARFRHNPHAVRHLATHAAISVNRSVEEILRIARREDWRAERLSRGPHEVVELWIDNCMLLELLTPEMTAAYLAAAPSAADA